MALLQPKITGDPVVDSWAAAVTRALNSGTLGGGGGNATTSASARNGNNGFNTATIYLFQRTTSESAPTGIENESQYIYSSGVLTSTNGGNTGDPTDADDGIDSGWFRAVPAESIQPGEYVWITSVNIADTGNTENISETLWFNPTLLSAPGQDGVVVSIEARSPDNLSADWVTLSNTSAASPNFKNDTAKVIGLVVGIYEGGVEVADSVYTDSTTSYVWTKNGEDFDTNETQVTGTGKDKRVLLINEMDVAEGNINEVFTCVIDY